MRFAMLSKVMIAGALVVSGVAQAAPRAPKWAGVWRNASNSIHLRAAPCGSAMCGTVIWANEKAKADVAAQGRQLIGTRLFSDFRPGPDGLWQGQVYVPDLDRSLAGTISIDGPNRISGTGCLLGSFGCKTQVWTRVTK